MLKHTSIVNVISIIAFGALLSHASGNDEISVQGTELVINTIAALESAIAEMSSLDIEQAISSIGQAGKIWNIFVDHHQMVYRNEVTSSPDIRTLISCVSGELDSVLRECDRIAETRDTTLIRAVIGKLTELRDSSQVPVLLDFTGAACKACKVMKTRLESVANDVAGTARVVIIDVNSQKDFTRRFKIMLIPTLVFISRKGDEITRHVGEMEVQAVNAKIAEMSE